MKFLLTTNPGIEDIVELEIREKFKPKSITKFLNLQGRVLVETSNKNIKKLLALRSIYHIIRYVNVFEIPVTKKGLDVIYHEVQKTDISELSKTETFRVTAKRIGNHGFTSMDIQAVAGKALVEKYSKKVSLKGFDTNIIVEVIGNKCWIGVCITRESLHKRFPKPFNHPASIKPPLAYAMLRLAEIDKGEAVLDPMCGGGTIPIEAAQVYGRKIKIFASDSNKKFLEGAKKNAKACGVEDLIIFKCIDVGEMEREYSKINKIVTNPPYGVRMGRWEGIKSLYWKFLESANKVLEKNGKIVTITLRAGSFRDMVFKSKHYAVIHERVVETGGLYPHVFILQKI